jgi:hypothetical protein
VYCNYSLCHGFTLTSFSHVKNLLFYSFIVWCSFEDDIYLGPQTRECMSLDNLIRVFFKTALQLAKMMNADGAKLL